MAKKSDLDSLLTQIRTMPLESRAGFIQLLMDAGKSQEAFELCLEGMRIESSPLLEKLAAAAVNQLPDSKQKAAKSKLKQAKKDKDNDIEDERLKVAENVLPIQSRSPLTLAPVESEKSTFKLAHVAGLHDVKRRLRLSFLGPRKNPALRDKFAADMQGGLLLWGPPGCGKTLIGKALAGELGASFLSYGLPDILGPYIGESEANLARIFETARKHAPAVLFFDEVDAIGQRRSAMHGGSSRNLIVQLLSEMDGISSDNYGVYVVGATNHPWDIDSALRRSGRFDHSIFVPPPDSDARHAIFKAELALRPCTTIDIDLLVKRTDGFSGADIALLCKVAAEIALDEAIEDDTRMLNHADLDEALKQVSATTGTWLQEASNVALFGADQKFYDPLRQFLKDRTLTV